jgi:hypothetical protein
MSEEEEMIEETDVEEAVTAGAEEDIEESIDIDLNAALLEAMVERTELLEKLVSGEIEASQLIAKLEEVKVPSLSKKKRRKRRK